MAKRQNPKPFDPIYGEVYENAGGGRFLCESKEGSSRSAWFTNVASGWTCLAKGIIRYEDGTVEWDYSTDGHFLPIDSSRQEAIFRATFRQRQRSIVNAMLCMI